ncbi:MAG: hypothetical protein EBR28_08230 [Planctomycetia bacterium]|nr:hypothetical protein [Planctomycetia bacterium]
MPMTNPNWQRRPAALIVAHPGHELRIHHWLELARPSVFILTDGSGSVGRSRVPSTLRVLEAAGARCGDVRGRFTDAELYDLLLQGSCRPLVEVAGVIADAIVGEGIHYVVHDAVEGYNPGHDLCWHLAAAAVALAEKRSGRPITRYDFLLTGRPDECPDVPDGAAIRVRLDEGALARKLAAAAAYPELKGELDAALERSGSAAFATEVLRPAPGVEDHLKDDGAVPFYERHGESRRASGRYREVVRRREHVLPLAESLRNSAAGR